MTFFFDENIGPGIVRALEKLGKRNLVHLLDEFEAGTPDTEWLPMVGSRGWALITKDQRIRYRTDEKRLYIAHNMAGFVLAGKNLDRLTMAGLLIKRFPRMEDLVASHRRPFLFAIYNDGMMKRLEIK